MRTRSFSLAFLVTAVVSSAAIQAQELPTQKVLTVDVAQIIAQEALAKCRADGHKVTVMVVDGTNTLKAAIRDDGAGMGTVEIVRMKINAVMAFGRPSGPPANLPAGTPAPPPLLPGTVNAAGAVPILVNNAMIGAVGVSGAPGGALDAACANAGLQKVADRLK